MPPPAGTPVVTLSQADRELLQRLAVAAEAIAGELRIISERWLNTTGDTRQ